MSGSFQRGLKRRLARAVSGLVRRPPLTAAALRALDPEAVLIVRQHNQMGDMVCATPCFRALRRTYPRARLVLVTAPVNAGVVRHNPHLDGVELFAQGMWRRPWRLLALIRRLRARRFTVAFVLSSVSFSLTSAWLALASGARYVVGADSLPFGWDFSRRAFSLELPARPELDRHAVAHSLAPLEAVGITTDDTAPVVVPAPGERAEARAILAAAGLAPGFWALHPGAGKLQNLWPASGFAEMAGRAAAAGKQVLILHGPADAGPLEDLVGRLGERIGRGLAVAPPCSVGTGAALLELCDRFLCNDTGVMHVAGAVGAPTLALFGPTDPALWKPPAAAVAALRSPGRRDDPRGPEHGWMENLEPGRVWEVWAALPGRPGAARKECD